MANKEKPPHPKATEMYEALKEAVDLKAKYRDFERVEVKRHFRKIILYGTEQDLAEALEAFGKGPKTEEGKAILAEFRKIRGLD